MLDDTVSFGDDANDVEMLASCGTEVAVFNAVKESSKAADCITLSNDEDGVADWIKKSEPCTGRNLSILGGLRDAYRRSKSAKLRIAPGLGAGTGNFSRENFRKGNFNKGNYVRYIFFG